MSDIFCIAIAVTRQLYTLSHVAIHNETLVPIYADTNSTVPEGKTRLPSKIKTKSHSVDDKRFSRICEASLQSPKSSYDLKNFRLSIGEITTSPLDISKNTRILTDH